MLRVLLSILFIAFCVYGTLFVRRKNKEYLAFLRSENDEVKRKAYRKEMSLSVVKHSLLTVAVFGILCCVMAVVSFS